MARILDGRKVAAKWEQGLQSEVGTVGRLVGVLVGADPASVLYLDLKGKIAKRLGIEFELLKFPAGVAKNKLKAAIEKLNADSAVAGIIVQLPLPVRLSSDEVVNWVDVSKDVDGLSDRAIAAGHVLPATALGIVELMRAYKIKVQNKKVVLVGFTRLLNVPLSIYLAKQGAQVVVLQKNTRKWNELKSADVVVSAVGVANLITAKDVKDGVVVLDAGIVKVGKKVVGDVDFEAVAKKAAAITPVPGGVGPMTLVALMSNLISLQKVALEDNII